MKKILHYHRIKNFPSKYSLFRKMFANIIYFVSGIAVHLRNNALNKQDTIEIRKNLRPGDIVIVGNLRELSHIFITGPVTHVMLYIGHKNFIHAIADGVKYATLNHVLHTYDTLAILRLPQDIPPRKQIIAKAIAEAKLQLGKPYDFEFSNNKERFYCSELVNHVYRKSGHKTKLYNFGQFRGVFSKIEKKLITARKALHPHKFVQGNFEVIFISHNLLLNNKKLFFF